MRQNFSLFPQICTGADAYFCQREMEIISVVHVFS